MSSHSSFEGYDADTFLMTRPGHLAGKLMTGLTRCAPHLSRLKKANSNEEFLLNLTNTCTGRYSSKINCFLLF